MVRDLETKTRPGAVIHALSRDSWYRGHLLLSANPRFLVQSSDPNNRETNLLDLQYEG